MSEINPYSPTYGLSADDHGIRKVKVRPLALIKRSYDLIGDQYWLFLGITLVGMLVGSAVPLGLLIGAMMAGIYLCFLHREQGYRVEFATLFKGFDYFAETLKAWLLMLCASMVVLLPFMAAIFVLVFIPMMESIRQSTAANQPPTAPQLPMALFILYPIALIANVLVTLPFLFVFQLIVDRNVQAMDAVRLSFRGVWRNFIGILWYIFVLMVLSMFLAMMCYLPAILFMPISFGTLFLLYRDIFGPGIRLADPPEAARPAPPPIATPGG